MGTLIERVRPTSRRHIFVAFEAVWLWFLATCGSADRALVSARAARERDDLFAKMGDVNDPFYLVKEEIQGSVDKAKGVTERMDRLPEYNGERVKYANAIVTECDSVKWQLEELDRATAMAERDFVRFKVDQNELASRKRWTAVTKDAVEAMRGNAQRVLGDSSRSTEAPRRRRWADCRASTSAGTTSTWMTSSNNNSECCERRMWTWRTSAFPSRGSGRWV